MTWTPGEPHQHTGTVQPVVPPRTSWQPGYGNKHTMVYNDKQLTAAIKNAATVERLAQLIHTCSLNPIHIATMFVKLTSLAKTPASGLAPAGFMSRERMQSLQAQQQLTTHLQQLLLATECAGHCCRGLANIVWALGKLQPEPEVLGLLLQKFFSQLSASVPQDVANVLWGVAQITRDRGLSPAFAKRAVGFASEQSEHGSEAALGANDSVKPLSNQSSESSSHGLVPSTAGASSSQQYAGLDAELSSASILHSRTLPLPQPLLSLEQVQQLLQRLVQTLHQAAPQTISNITCALCVLQHCHQWCMCSCLPQIREILTAFSSNISEALPSHVQKVVKCLMQLSLACSSHARKEWVEWQPPLLQAMLNHLVLQRKALKQFHIASVLRDITQLSCLFLPAEQAAEVAGTTGAADQQLQEQQVLLAVAAAGAAVDETLDFHGRGLAGDDLDDDVLGLGTIGSLLVTSSNSFNATRLQEGSVGAASASGGSEQSRQPSSPVSALVHNIVAGMFRRLVLEDRMGVCSGDGNTSKTWADAVDEAEGLCQQEQGSEGTGASPPVAMVVSSPELRCKAASAADHTQASTQDATGNKPANSTVLERLMPQLERLGVLQQYNTLKALCALQGPVGLGATGAAAGASFMQPNDKGMYARAHSMQELYQKNQQRSIGRMTWQQEQQVHEAAGGPAVLQQRWWESRQAQQQPPPLGASYPGAGYQRGLTAGPPAHGRSGMISHRNPLEDGSVAGGTVGRVFVQQQPGQQHRMLSGSHPRSGVQYRAPDVLYSDQGRRQYQQQQLQQQQFYSSSMVVQQSADAAATTDQNDAVMISPFERSATIFACGIPANPSASGPPGFNSPAGSNTSFTAAPGLQLLSSSSMSGSSTAASYGAARLGGASTASSLKSGQTHSGATSSAVGSGSSFVSQGSASFSTMGSVTTGNAPAASFGASLSATSVGHSDARVGAAASLPSYASAPAASSATTQQHVSFSAERLQQHQQSPPGVSSGMGNVSVAASPSLLAGGSTMMAQQPAAAAAAAANAGMFAQPPGLVSPQQQQQQPAQVPIVIIQHDGQDMAYKKMSDGTLVPVNLHQQSQTALGAPQFQVQQQQLQQQAALTNAPSLEVNTNPAGPQADGIVMQQPLQFTGGAVTMPTAADVASSTGLGLLQQQQQMDSQAVLRYYMPAGAASNAGQTLLLSGGVSQQINAMQQGVAANTLMDANSMLAANQLLIQQQQQQMQQQQQQMQLQQQQLQQAAPHQFVQLPNGQLVQVSGGYLQTAGDAAGQASNPNIAAAAGLSGLQATSLGLSIDGNVVLTPEAAQLLAGMQGQQQQGQQQLAMQQQQQVYYVMPGDAGF